MALTDGNEIQREAQEIVIEAIEATGCTCVVETEEIGGQFVNMVYEDGCPLHDDTDDNTDDDEDEEPGDHDDFPMYLEYEGLYGHYEYDDYRDFDLSNEW